MDISSYFDLYRSTTENYGWYAALWGLGALVATTVSIPVALVLTKLTKESVIGTFAGVGAAVVVFIVLASQSLSYLHAIEPTKDLIASVAAGASEHYDVAVPVDAVREAYKGTDTGVVSFGAEHDGMKKSLDIQLDKDAETVTIYEGNMELVSEK